MICRDARDVDLVDALAQNRRALEQKTSEREQVAAIVRHRIFGRARRLLQRASKRLDLHLHHLARTHLSGYAISGDSAEKARLSRWSQSTAGNYAADDFAMNCWHCARKIEVVIGERIGFRDECPGCGRALHSCRNCGFYDPAYNNSCREPMAERVVDKERFNFCEYFIPSDAAAKPQVKTKTAAQDKLEALFKKKS